MSENGELQIARAIAELACQVARLATAQERIAAAAEIDARAPKVLPGGQLYWPLRDSPEDQKETPK